MNKVSKYICLISLASISLLYAGCSQEKIVEQKPKVLSVAPADNPHDAYMKSMKNGNAAPPPQQDSSSTMYR